MPSRKDFSCLLRNRQWHFLLLSMSAHIMPLLTIAVDLRRLSKVTLLWTSLASARGLDSFVGVQYLCVTRVNRGEETKLRERLFLFAGLMSSVSRPDAVRLGDRLRDVPEVMHIQDCGVDECSPGQLDGCPRAKRKININN